MMNVFVFTGEIDDLDIVVFKQLEDSGIVQLILIGCGLRGDRILTDALDDENIGIVCDGCLAVAKLDLIDHTYDLNRVLVAKSPSLNQ